MGSSCSCKQQQQLQLQAARLVFPWANKKFLSDSMNFAAAGPRVQSRPFCLPSYSADDLLAMSGFGTHIVLRVSGTYLGQGRRFRYGTLQRWTCGSTGST